jgi:hypothetical protein
MKTVSRPGFPRAAFVLACAALGYGWQLPASAQGAGSEIAKARSECAQQKQRVASLEARSGNPDADPALTQARRQWEQACAHAQKLMEQAGVDHPPPPTRPPLPPTVIVIPPSAVNPTRVPEAETPPAPTPPAPAPDAAAPAEPAPEPAATVPP